MKYSIIVPVFNRPDEVEELLASLLLQTFSDFEVIIVEDGSQKPCKDVCDRYSDRLDLHYFMKPNSGPGQSRNYGAERASGEYLLILDSDVVLPKGYLQAVEDELQREPADAFGGPDAAHDSFTDTQKAISYSMTSFFTTGGIRGGKKNWINSILARSIWAFVVMFIWNLKDFLKCALVKILTFLFAFSKLESVAVCSLKHGYGTNVAPIFASFGDRFTIQALPESIFTRNILNR